MARFTGLALELQEAIWAMVLPPRGGIHWIQIEGVPHPPDTIRESLDRVRDLFDDKEPVEPSAVQKLRAKNRAYFDYTMEKARDDDYTSPFFESLYVIPPSLWGRGGKPIDHEVDGEEEELAETRRCRQFSTYTQIATLLSTCRVSRMVALRHLDRMTGDGTWPLYRSVGPLARPRQMSIWKKQYRHGADPPILPGEEDSEEDALVPKICATLDLVVFRLHTASGHATDILKHVVYQLRPENCCYDQAVLPSFDRVGIEWHPMWAAPECRRECEAIALRSVMQLLGDRTQLSTQFYWLVDGIPRPKWDEYPPAIPKAFEAVIASRKKNILRYWDLDEEHKERLLTHHDLHQEFEANGRRYYVVFVVTEWTSDDCLAERYRDSSIDWDSPFPGGEALWPEALRAPVQMAYDIRADTGTDLFSTYILSWEPICS